MSNTLSRRQIVRAFRARGWTVGPKALEGVEEYLDAGADLKNLLNVIASEIGTGRTVSDDLWTKVVQHQLEEAEDNANDNDDASLDEQTRHRRRGTFANVQVVSAFETPKLVFDSMRKNFSVQQEAWPLLGTAEDKVRVGLLALHLRLPISEHGWILPESP
jgi:hypothetical protein